MDNTKRNIILLVLAVAICIAPMAMFAGLGEDEGYFTGTDDVASEIVDDSGYEPNPIVLWEPPSAEIESLLFAVQAAIGGIILGYFIGFWQGQASHKSKEEDE
jgi:cobalt/nickel transport protein